MYSNDDDTFIKYNSNENSNQNCLDNSTLNCNGL